MNNLIYLDSFIECIEKKNEKNVAIYITIGCASHMKKYDPQKGWILEQQYNHQFPLCLQKLKNLQPWSPLHIIMIDPMLEELPFIVMHHSGNKLDIGWEKDKHYENIYHNDISNMHVYTFRCSAINICTPNKDIFKQDDGYFDITEFLHKLNSKAIENKWFVLYSDFTGVKLKEIATYFDPFLGDNRNHIIYGIGSRDNDGCYIDLTSPECNFYYTFFDDSIQVFNPYVYDKNIGLAIEIGKHIVECEDENTKNIILSQIKSFIKIKIYFILETVIEVFRQVSYKIKDNTFKIGMSEKYRYFENTYHIDFSDPERRIYEIYVQVMDSLKIELRNFFGIFDENKDICNELVETIIKKLVSEKSVYNYQSIVREFINNIIGKKLMI